MHRVDMGVCVNDDAGEASTTYIQAFEPFAKNTHLYWFDKIFSTLNGFLKTSAVLAVEIVGLSQ